MVDGGTETNISVTYDDNTGKLNFISEDTNTQLTQAEIEAMGFSTTDTNTQLSTEEVQDIIGAMVSNNTETNIAVTYDDNTGKLNFISEDTNTQLTQAEIEAMGFSTTDTNTQLSTEEVQDIIGAMVSNNTETNIAVTYDDNTGKLNFVSTDTNTDNNLNNDLNPNINVGGISTSDTFTAGDDIEALLRKLLIQYQKSVLSSLNIYNNGNIIDPDFSQFEAGENIKYNSVKFTATQDDPNGNFPTTVSFKGDNGTIIATESSITANNTLSISEQTLSPTSDIPAAGKTVIIKLDGKSGDGSTNISTTKSYNFRWKNYLCASSIDLKNENNKSSEVTTILSNGLIRSVLDANKQWSPLGDSNTANGSNYTYIMYPSNYGEINSILFNNAGLDQSGAFSLITTLEIENSYGSKLLYKIYQSNAPGVVSNTDRLYIN